MRSLILMLTSCVICFAIGYSIGLEQREDTHDCQVKELELKKEIDEYKWRYELVNEINR